MLTVTTVAELRHYTEGDGPACHPRPDPTDPPRLAWAWRSVTCPECLAILAGGQP